MSLPERSVEQWAKVLREKWLKLADDTVRGFAEFGAYLIEAKNSVEHGEWLGLLEQMPFDRQTAQRMMRINRWLHSDTVLELEKFHQVNFLELLPPDQLTIDQLSRLKPKTLTKLVDNKIITPKLRRNELKVLFNAEKVDADVEYVKKLVPRIGKYRTIVMDPAWEFDEFSKTAVAEKLGQYARQSMSQLMTLGPMQWAESECHLYCWAPNAYVAKACFLVQQWGFEYKGILTWQKLDSAGNPVMGLGHNWRNGTEKVIFAMKGQRGTRRNDLPDWFSAPRGEHSEKPEEFYDVVRAASYPPYGEANQRKLRPDFTDLFMAGEPLCAAV